MVILPTRREADMKFFFESFACLVVYEITVTNSEFASKL